MRRVSAVVLVFATSLFAQDKTGDKPLVTVSLADYQKLTSTPTAATVVVDTIQLSGSFHDNALTISFRGRAIGAPPATEVITGAKDLTISGCGGEAMIARAAKGAFSIVPLREDFTAHCSLQLSGSDRVQLHVTPTVLGVRSSVSDGELVANEEDADGGRTYALVRQVTAGNGTLPVTATGRYLVTLLPDTTRFRYAIDVHNPNRGTSSLPLTFASGEHLQQIDAASQYEVKDGHYIFAIAPGDSSIVLTGELLGRTFSVPVDATLQYLVVESHPLLRAMPRGARKRVSVAETGVRPAYRGALAFEIGGGERIEWNVTRLEALHSISYALSGARHQFFVPADGPVLGESSFELQNQGAAEAIVPATPRPSYVSLQDQPVLITKNREGRLTVPLSTGQQVLFLQHMQTFRHALGFGFATLDVPQLPVAATGTFTTIRYASEWLPLVESFASRTKLWAPKPWTLFLARLFWLWCERPLAMLGLGWRRAAIAALVALTAASSIFAITVTALVLGFSSLIALAPVPSQRWGWARIAAALGAVILSVILALYPTYARVSDVERMMSGSGGLASSAPRPTLEGMNEYDEMSRATGAAYIHASPSKDGLSQELYQGLPARFELPLGERFTSFGTELLRVDRPQQVAVLMLSAGLLWWMHAMLIAAAAFLLWRGRSQLGASLSARFATPAAAPA